MTTTNTPAPTIVRVIRQSFPSSGYTTTGLGGWNREEEIIGYSESFSGEIILPDGQIAETIRFNCEDPEWTKDAVETVALRKALEIEASGKPVVLEFDGYEK